MNAPAATAPRELLTGVLLAGAGAIAFSCKAIIIKLAYRYGVDAVTTIMYRMLFAFPLFLALSWWSGRNKPSPTAQDWRTLFGLGFCGYYLASYLDFAGLQYISANLERLILYLNPTVVLLAGKLLFKTEVSRRQWLALGVSYIGVLVVFGHDVRAGPDIALGAILVFGSAVSYAIYLVYSGQIVRRLGALRVTGLGTSIACILCIAQFFILKPPSAMIVAPEVIWLSALNAVLCTFIPVLITMMALERIGAGVTAQIGMIGPMSTIILSVLILGEPFTVWIAIGTGLVVAGVWLLAQYRVRPHS
ncbi:multidrug DMT transporter permease [Steroidobacter agaridevorans]|uniref:Multidrug DMT transporter permease n=1 Tax=Steroidobacter agaridevorans TaxID=2695856 RepID=A0A829YDP3_9GAMM|nr:DMT family transporter [Steroidobacter agaridevorans]GFE81073.1 multidrug DMT transporter permease [Steroidobacter agaridevorans]